MFFGKINLYFGSMWLYEKLIVVVICCVAPAAVSGQDNEPFAAGQPQGKIRNTTINEASGLIASQKSPGHFWTHNDSGDQARIFLIDDAARHKATFYLQGIHARDWEDIGMLERDGRNYLVVGDIGDNNGQYRCVNIHLFEEPSANMLKFTVDTIRKAAIQSFALRYEDGPRDAESLFFDPIDKRLYIITKRELEVGVYWTVLPENPIAMDTLLLRKAGTLPLTFITSADISPNGNELLMKNLLGVFYWKREPGESVPEMLSKPAVALPYLPEPQGEAIAFSHDGRDYYTLSEAPLGMDAILYCYKRL